MGQPCSTGCHITVIHWYHTVGLYRCQLNISVHGVRWLPCKLRCIISCCASFIFAGSLSITININGTGTGTGTTQWRKRTHVGDTTVLLLLLLLGARVAVCSMLQD